MPRHWLRAAGLGNRNVDLTLYNTPGTNQYKYAWWGTMPLISGTLREVRIRVAGAAGSPTLQWAIYPSVPASGGPTGTPAASGTITNVTANTWYTLTTDANMSVTRGQPFLLYFACTAGTSVAIAGVVSTDYQDIFTLSPAGTWWASVDGNTWAAAPAGTNAHIVSVAVDYSIESGGNTEWFGIPVTGTLSAQDSMGSTSTILGQSYQLPQPIRIEGVAFHINTPSLALGLIRCELRTIDTGNWQPNMGSEGLIDSHEAEMSWQTVSGIDNTKHIALFTQARQVQNFAVLLRWARHDSGSISLRVSSPFDSAPLTRHGVNSIMRNIHSSNGGSTWTVRNDRVARIVFLGDPYQVSTGGGSGAGVFVPMTRIIT